MRATALASAIALALAAFSAAPASADTSDNPLKDAGSWAELRADVVGDAAIHDGSGLFTLEAPYRAHDAAVVPIRITQAPFTQTPGDDRRIVKLTLVIDENPAPVAAEFELHPLMGRLDLEMRVRLDQYSNIRAIAETADGRLWMTGRYVKGAGGCSAPAMKDMEAALAAAGQMRLKFTDSRADASPPRSGAVRQAQVMLRHPNYSGMQRNQVTNLLIPAFYVNEITVKQGQDTLFTMQGGISVSENPTFRFEYIDNGAGTLSVIANDTEGGTFTQRLTAEPAS